MIQPTEFPLPDDQPQLNGDESACANDDEMRATIESVFGAGALDLLSEDDSADIASAAQLSADAATGDSVLLSSGLAAGVIQRAHQGPKHILFELNEQQYAVAIENVVEILHLPTIRRLPRLPHWLKGVFNRRGEAVSVVDCREYFALPSVRNSEDQRLLVTRTDLGELTVGLIVDQIVGIRHLHVGSTPAAPLPTNAHIDEFLTASVELQGRFVGVLDIDRLLNSPRMRQFEQTQSAVTTG